MLLSIRCVCFFFPTLKFLVFISSLSWYTRQRLSNLSVTAWSHVDTCSCSCITGEDGVFILSWTSLDGPVNPSGCISLSDLKETEMEPLLGERTVFWTFFIHISSFILVSTVEIYRLSWQTCSSINLLLVTQGLVAFFVNALFFFFRL